MLSYLLPDHGLQFGVLWFLPKSTKEKFIDSNEILKIKIRELGNSRYANNLYCLIKLSIGSRWVIKHISISWISTM